MSKKKSKSKAKKRSPFQSGGALNLTPDQQLAILNDRCGDKKGADYNRCATEVLGGDALAAAPPKAEARK